jgi:hypothetical protein
MTEHYDEAAEIQRLAASLPPLPADGQRIGDAATGYLKRMLEGEAAGHLRWDPQLKDWRMTPRHPAFGADL